MTHTMRAVLVSVALVGVLGLTACGDDSSGAEATTETPLEAVAQNVKDGPISGELRYVQVQDDGHTLVIDGEGQESDGAQLETIIAVLAVLDAPSSVVAKMSNTRALDGMQDASWDAFTATWTYHPDNGLDIIVEQSA